MGFYSPLQRLSHNLQVQTLLNYIICLLNVYAEILNQFQLIDKTWLCKYCSTMDFAEYLPKVHFKTLVILIGAFKYDHNTKPVLRYTRKTER
jgi:hypothetical protein